MSDVVIPRTTLSRRILADEVYEQLMVYLIDGRLEAGLPVSIDGMAREMDVSPTPVREALARLESTGLVTRVALKGYRVAPLFTPQELSLLMDARQVIEPVNARLACQRSTSEFCDALAETIDALRRAPRGPSFAEFRPYWEADERFHRLIAERADNPFLLRAYESLGGQVQRFRFFGGLGVTDADFAIAEHSAIHAAFVKGDPELAFRAMETHIVKVRQRALLDSAAKA